MTLRGILAALDQAQEDRLSDEQRDWLLVAATTREIHQARQRAIDERIDEVAGTSSSAPVDRDACRRREFWLRVEETRLRAREDAAGLVPFERRLRRR